MPHFYTTALRNLRGKRHTWHFVISVCVISDFKRLTYIKRKHTCHDMPCWIWLVTFQGKNTRRFGASCNAAGKCMATTLQKRYKNMWKKKGREAQGLYCNVKSINLTNILIYHVASCNIEYMLYCLFLIDNIISIYFWTGWTNILYIYSANTDASVDTENHAICRRFS